ncbi:MAG TPA: tetratricopeptide repeat protein [Azospirillaceae bacterium]|nr:tetratricopeptide repeat protein [Azospirillaceae bacterium]
MSPDLDPTASRPDLAGLLAAGLAHHQAGRLPEAEAAYRRVLAMAPQHAGALQMMGVVALQRGTPALAVELLAQAARLDATSVSCLANLAAALRAAGRLEEALAACARALTLDSACADAVQHLARILSDQERHGDAAKALRRLLELRPLLTEPRLELGRLLLLDGQHEAAAEEMEILLGMTPASAPAYSNLGVALRRLGRLDAAVAAYRSALAFAPGDPGILSNLGILLMDLDRYAEAAACFHQAIAAKPDFATAHLNLCLLARDEMRLEDAIASARAAIGHAPALAEAHTALAHCLLLSGRLKEGFAEYEWRSRMAEFPSPRRSFASPSWDGTEITGRTLVIHDEQGVGDTLMAVRYAALLQARGVRVIVECNTQLVRLLSGMPGVAGVVSRYDPLPDHDYHVSLLSLPHLLGTTFYTVPDTVPYLRAEATLVEAWAQRLGERRGLRVGLVWAGNPEFKADRLRSPRLPAYLPLLDIEGVEFFGLQLGAGRADLETAGPLPPAFRDLGGAISDFADTAAIMCHLDLVISSCTAPAHLAGALGRPVWTILPFSPDWRWFGNGTDTPWYPTMRLFRQERPGDWTGVMARAGDALRQLAATASAPGGG